MIYQKVTGNLFCSFFTVHIYLKSTKASSIDRLNIVGELS